jgi:hypothetical protein
MFDITWSNLISPAVLFFVLGWIGARLKSDLKFPEALSEGLSIYLLIAIGLKGGIELSHQNIEHILAPLIGTLLLGIIIPLIVLWVCWKWVGMDLKHSVALAACYGSVSIVTYGASVSFLNELQVNFENYTSALVVLLESPAILVALLMMKIIEQRKPTFVSNPRSLGIIAGTGSAGKIPYASLIKESVLGKSVLLLTGGIMVGLVCGPDKLPVIKPLFIDMFSGILVLFLLNMGLVAGQQLGAVTQYGWKLFVAGILFPIFFGAIGVLVGFTAGLSLGGTTIMGVLAGSASYIAAPAAMRTAVPEANPSVYLGLSIGVTFPFNLIFGIPFFYQLAVLLH